MTAIYDEANSGKHLSLQHLNLAYAVSCILVEEELIQVPQSLLK